MVEEGLRDRDSERASGAGRLIVETSAGLHCRQEPQLRRCGQERKNRYCSSVEGNLIVNKGELQYYDYSIAVSSTSLLALMHVPNLVAAPVWFVRRMYGASYADINNINCRYVHVTWHGLRHQNPGTRYQVLALLHVYRYLVLGSTGTVPCSLFC